MYPGYQQQASGPIPRPQQISVMEDMAIHRTHSVMIPHTPNNQNMYGQEGLMLPGPGRPDTSMDPFFDESAEVLSPIDHSHSGITADDFVAPAIEYNAYNQASNKRH